MNNCQDFPETVEEFMDEYKMVDTEEVYSNGTEYVPIFRMKQWFEHERNTAYPEKGKWIPCSERLPKMKEIVLITNDKGHVRCGQYRGIGSFSKNDGRPHWNWKGNTLETVVAWMPLPEPYRGEE